MKEEIQKILYTELTIEESEILIEKLLDLFNVSKKQLEEAEQKGYDKGHFDALMKMMK